MEQAKKADTKATFDEVGNLLDFEKMNDISLYIGLPYPFNQEPFEGARVETQANDGADLVVNLPAKYSEHPDQSTEVSKTSKKSCCRYC